MVLRKLQEEDAEGMLEWMNDSEIQKCFRFTMGNRTKTEALEFIRNAEIDPVHGKDVHYAIADENNEYWGTVSLKAINFTDKNAEYAISLRKEAQGKGMGYEATRKILKAAFEEFGLERVYLNVLSDNLRAIKLYEKCGFIYEGEFRNHLFLRGEYKTLKWYGMLKEDFQKICAG